MGCELSSQSRQSSIKRLETTIEYYSRNLNTENNRVKVLEAEIVQLMHQNANRQRIVTKAAELRAAKAEIVRLESLVSISQRLLKKEVASQDNTETNVLSPQELVAQADQYNETLEAIDDDTIGLLHSQAQFLERPPILPAQIDDSADLQTLIDEVMSKSRPDKVAGPAPSQSNIGQTKLLDDVQAEYQLPDAPTSQLNDTANIELSDRKATHNSAGVLSSSASSNAMRAKALLQSMQSTHTQAT